MTSLLDYNKLGFKCGLECHQQIEGSKLFCNCPSLVNDPHEPDIIFERTLHVSTGELGNIDTAAVFEVKKGKVYRYEACSTSSCLVELDEEPIHPVNKDALHVVLEVSLLLHAKIIDELQPMRKIVLDGSNVSSFQRTILVATDGYLDTSKGRVTIPSICLEEEAAKKIEEKEHVVTYRLDRLGVALIEIATDASIKDPEHAKEVASLLGMILRSTGKVKRGIGSVRQDVNLSITGHPRVELKGFQDLRTMPKVIETEVQRQLQEKGKKPVAHVRKVEPDGRSTYLRPMPGAARMYPETDAPVIRVTKEMVASVVLPELVDAKVLRFEKTFHLNAEMARLVVEEDIPIDTYVKTYPTIDPTFIVQTLVNFPKEIKKRYNVDPSALRDNDFAQVFGLLVAKRIAKEAVVDILAEIAQGKKVDVNKYTPIDTSKLENELLLIVRENPGASLNALMGEAMRRYRGKVDGKVIIEILKKLMPSNE